MLQDLVPSAVSTCCLSSAVAAAPVSMCACVFPDASEIDLTNLTYFSKMLVLRVETMPLKFIDGQEDEAKYEKTKWLPAQLGLLHISGKLQRHVSAVDISTTYTNSLTSNSKTKSNRNTWEENIRLALKECARKFLAYFVAQVNTEFTEVLIGQIWRNAVFLRHCVI